MSEQSYLITYNPKFPTTSRKLCGESAFSKIGWKFEFALYDPEPGKYIFSFGTDFGFGTAIYIDGVLNWYEKMNVDHIFSIDEGGCKLTGKYCKQIKLDLVY